MKNIFEGHQALIGHDWHGGIGGGHFPQQFFVVFAGRLLQQFYPKWLSAADEIQRLCNSIALVGIEAYFQSRAGRFPDTGYFFNIRFYLRPTFKLYHLKAFFSETHSPLHRLCQGHDTDGDASGDAIPIPSQEFVKRLARLLGHEVVEH